MIQYPFAIISDVHMNDWSQFSYIREDKVNSRLYETIEAVWEAVGHLRRLGGKDLIITGDLFHTRGKIKPSVYNPVYDAFQTICRSGINVWCLPGNHDLEGKESDTIGNAIHPFEAIPFFRIFDEVSQVDNFIFIPWIEHKDDFTRIINDIVDPADKVVFCHIGIDGVLDQVAGKVGKAVLDKGFKYVFSGDYHNHKALGNGIYSVGALTHHGFGDVGSRAGYLIVEEDKVTQVETKAPKFVNHSSLHIAGNIVRIQGEYTEQEAEEIKESLQKEGALYVQDLSTRPTLKETSHSTTAVRVDLSFDHALESYTKLKYGDNYEAVLANCRRIRLDNV